MMRPPYLALAALIAGYGLSQFYRAFLTVLAPLLQAELGVTPGDLAVASGLWFLAFAVVQLPIGWALDAIGPGRTAGGVLGLCGAGGALIFSLGTRPLHLDIGMALMGVGCAPVLMAAYYLLARAWPAASFGALAGIVVGLGSLGDILSAAPLVRVVEAFGWRATLQGMAGLTVIVGALIAVLVPTPPAPDHDPGLPRAATLGALLRVSALWPMLPLVFASYACSVAIRGLWAAPFLQTVHAGDARMIGHAALVMGLSTVAGNLLTGPAVRLFGSPRRAVIRCAAAAIVALAVLTLWPDAGMGVTYAALAVLGMSGANYALLMTHGRPFIPPHLLGRGITFLNMVSLSGVGLLQLASRPVYQSVLAASGPRQAITAVFLFFLVPLVVGLAVFLTTREPGNAPARA